MVNDGILVQGLLNFLGQVVALVGESRVVVYRVEDPGCLAQ